jgi:hypothetical protein
MTTSQLRAKLQQLLASTDDKELLEAIYILLKRSQSMVEESVAHYLPVGSSSHKSPAKKIIKKDGEDYTKPGKPMSKEAFWNLIETAKKGKSTSHKDFLKEVEKWQ